MIGGPFDRYPVRDETPKPGELEYLAPQRYRETLVAAAHQHQGATVHGQRITWLSIPVRGRRRG